MSNTLAQRQISHELVMAWDDVRVAGNTFGEPEWVREDARTRMWSAIDAIIAAYTPGYNAESEPEYPEEYDDAGNLSEDAKAAMESLK